MSPKGQTAPRLSHDPFWSLVDTARRLQAPGGCRWDRAQTVSSLLPYFIEETWEVFEVVRSRRYRELEEELGDALYTVLFLALVAERHGWCKLDTLLRGVQAKMVRRHPHIFAGGQAPTIQSAVKRWHEIKRAEGRKRHSPSKEFRKTLVAWWDWLRTHPRASGTPRRPSGRRART